MEFIPVLPPTELSTCAKSAVGHGLIAEDRSYRNETKRPLFAYASALLLAEEGIQLRALCMYGL